MTRYAGQKANRFDDVEPRKSWNRHICRGVQAVRDETRKADQFRHIRPLHGGPAVLFAPVGSVDVGWISVEGGYSKRERLKQAGFAPPLDEHDGAARICDPIFRGVQGEPVNGQLLRHFESAPW